MGTKKWEKWSCPDPDRIISRPNFWSSVEAGDTDQETCSEDEYDSEDNEYFVQKEEEKFPRRRLLVGNIGNNPSPTPTWKLDQKYASTYDQTIKKLLPMKFTSREGIELNMDHRSLTKVVYSHSEELGIADPSTSILCPVQHDNLLN